MTWMRTWDDGDDRRDEEGTIKTRVIQMTCSECGFSCEDDSSLMDHHSCDVQKQGGYCEDYPCCGHERGDCNGLRYGSDEKIKEEVYRAFTDPEFAWRLEQQAEYDSYWG